MKKYKDMTELEKIDLRIKRLDRIIESNERTLKSLARIDPFMAVFAYLFIGVSVLMLAAFIYSFLQ